MIKIKKVNEFNNSKMFDNHLELLQHGEKYIEDLYADKSTRWDKHFREILNDDVGYNGKAYYLKDLIGILEKEENMIQNFMSDITQHIYELDDIYKVNQKLSDTDDESYEDLENLSYIFDKFLDQLKEYKKEIESVTQSFINIDNKVSHIKEYKWNLLK